MVPVNYWLYAGTLLSNSLQSTGTLMKLVPANNFLYTGTVPVHIFLFTGILSKNGPCESLAVYRDFPHEQFAIQRDTHKLVGANKFLYKTQILSPEIEKPKYKVLLNQKQKST